MVVAAYVLRFEVLLVVLIKVRVFGHLNLQHEISSYFFSLTTSSQLN